MTDERNAWMPAAQLLRPQGRRGEILAEPHTEFSTFCIGRRLWLASSAAVSPSDEAERTVEAAWQPTGKNAGRLVLKLAGVETISAAEALSGQFLLLRTSELPPLEPGTFRVRDLVGCTLFDGKQPVGTVVDVQFPIAADGRTRLQDAPDLLAVLPTSSQEDVLVHSEGEVGELEAEPTLVPFVRAWLVEVDLPAQRIVMHLPSGIFDLPNASSEDLSSPATDSPSTDFPDTAL